MDSLVDIVIVNWNSGKQLGECVRSISLYGRECAGRVIVVDNGSTDNSLTFDDCGISIDVLRAGQNLGFAKACNLGALHCSSPYILFFNPDARFMPYCLERVLIYMQSESSARIGICGVRLVDENGATQRHCARFPSWRIYLGHSLGLNSVMPRIFPSRFLLEFDHLSNRMVDHVIGAFFLVRRELFQTLNGFDERFFVYLEDLDFSLRAKKAGWKTWYLAEAVAFHKGGGVSEQVKAHRLFYSLRSRMLYSFKNFSRLEAWGVVGITMFLEPISRMMRAALRGSMQELRDTARGYGMLWVDLPRILRRAI